MPTKSLTVADAAAELNVTPARVYAMIRAGRLKADRFGSAWMITPAAVDAVRDRKPGRPPSKKKAKKQRDAR